ncbi:hypothetical protein LCGC14_1517460 [marine sediment metagenome]|uniref:Uncharacterized protein n=1 Tax=marine sediment metagenome TaxID=412755 RepID=A0A0F9IZW0_9ZZZZ
MWEYVTLGLVVGLMLLVALLFWLMFRREDRQTEKQLTVWNQVLHTCTVVIDELMKERQIQVQEKQNIARMLADSQQWLVHLVTTTRKQQGVCPPPQNPEPDPEPQNPEPDPEPERRSQATLAGVHQPSKDGPTALGHVLTEGDGA